MGRMFEREKGWGEENRMLDRQKSGNSRCDVAFTHIASRLSSNSRSGHVLAYFVSSWTPSLVVAGTVGGGVDIELETAGASPVVVCATGISPEEDPGGGTVEEDEEEACATKYVKN